MSVDFTAITVIGVRANKLITTKTTTEDVPALVNKKPVFDSAGKPVVKTRTSRQRVFITGDVLNNDFDLEEYLGKNGDLQYVQEHDESTDNVNVIGLVLHRCESDEIGETTQDEYTAQLTTARQDFAKLGYVGHLLLITLLQVG